MGEHELQEALRREAQAQVRTIWQAAEAAVAVRRAEVTAELAALREESARRRTATVSAEHRTRLSVAATAARQQQLTTETALLERLYRLAVQMLPELGAERRHRSWRTLVGEVPPGKWQYVRVSPEDVAQARHLFPLAEVESAPDLGGGLVVATVDARLVVDNSLAGRLERCWPELQPLLLAMIQKEVSDDAVGVSPPG